MTYELMFSLLSRGGTAFLLRVPIIEVTLGIYASLPKVISYKFCHHLSLFWRKLPFSNFMKIFREFAFFVLCPTKQTFERMFEHTWRDLFQVYLFQRLWCFCESSFLLDVWMMGIETLGHSHSQWRLKIKGKGDLIKLPRI